MRRLSVLLAVGTLAACSGGSDATSSVPAVEPATTAASGSVVSSDEPASDDAAGSAEAGQTEAQVGAAASDAEAMVSIAVAASGFTSPDVSLDLSAAYADDVGPFGEFGSCSGSRAFVGAYSIFVSGSDGAVNVWTADRVTAAGIYDAEVRVEPTSGDPLIGSGTITVLDGLQSGEFVAFGADGGRLEGTFACEGTPSPEPLPLGAVGDDALDTVEVFALLRDGDAERVVALAVDGTADAECPAAEGGAAGPTVVRADGDERLGAITTFELSDGPATARLRIGGRSFEFPDVTLTLEPDGTAGIFAAANPDGTSVDGAFRCT